MQLTALSAAGDRRTRQISVGSALMHAENYDARPVQSPRWGACSSRSEREITAVTGGRGLHGPTRAASNGSLAGSRTASTSVKYYDKKNDETAAGRDGPSALLSFAIVCFYYNCRILKRTAGQPTLQDVSKRGDRRTVLSRPPPRRRR